MWQQKRFPTHTLEKGFILFFWTEKSGHGQPRCWSFDVEDPIADKIYSFTDMDTLLTFLQTQVTSQETLNKHQQPDA